MLQRREMVDFARRSSLARHAAMVDICSESVSEVDRRRRKSERSIADRYFCNPSGVRRPDSEHSIAARYFCNPSGAPKSAGGRPGEAFGANPREGWLRRVAGEGAPGCPREALRGESDNIL